MCNVHLLYDSNKYYINTIVLNSHDCFMISGIHTCTCGLKLALCILIIVWKTLNCFYTHEQVVLGDRM